MTWKLIERRQEYLLACYENLVAMYRSAPLPNPDIEKNPKSRYDLKTDQLTWLDDMADKAVRP